MNQISKPKCDNVTAWPTVTEMHSTPDLSQLVIPTLSPGRSQSPAAQESTTLTPPLLSQEVTASHLVKKKCSLPTEEETKLPSQALSPPFL